MINIFTLNNGRLIQQEVDTLVDLEKSKPIWIDLELPTLEEKKWIKTYYNLIISDDLTKKDLEESARFYEEDDGNLYIKSDFLVEDSKSLCVAFILNQNNENNKNILFSVHNEDIPVFRLLRMRARSFPGFIDDAKEVLLKLFDANVEYAADNLENIYNNLDKISKLVLTDEINDDSSKEILNNIAIQEDLNGKIKRNVLDNRRAISFIMRSKILSAEQFENIRQVLRDIESLDSHTSFLFEKINFLMDATVGFININQNKIIKIFSVGNMILLPPTLIASIYGMNFEIMPELTWKYGYVYAIILMMFSAIIPMIYFKRKGWLT